MFLEDLAVNDGRVVFYCLIIMASRVNSIYVSKRAWACLDPMEQLEVRCGIRGDVHLYEFGVFGGTYFDDGMLVHVAAIPLATQVRDGIAESDPNHDTAKSVFLSGGVGVMRTVHVAQLSISSGRRDARGYCQACLVLVGSYSVTIPASDVQYERTRNFVENS